MSVWELESESEAYRIVRELIENHHNHLSEAKIVLYASDKNKNRGDKVVIAEAARASSKMKASINADFTITLHMMPWGDLNQAQKKACLDHELYHCGVHYVPITEQIGAPNRNGKAKMRVVKDEYGRIQYTNEIKRDEEGVPKWKLISHDLEEFRDVVERHGIWDESLQSFKEAIDKIKTNTIQGE